MFKKLLIHFIFWSGFFLAGCGTSPVSNAPTVQPKYELMLSGTIDGVKFQGVGVGNDAPRHSMVIKSNVAVNYFTMQSCHRSIQFDDVIVVPWYDWSQDSKSFSWEYNEASTIEDTGNCILRFCAFSKTVGSPPVACAIVDFKNKKYSLPSKNICNGQNGDATGTSICHTQVGLLERMRFPGPVVIAPQVVDPTSKTAPYWITTECVGKFLDDAQTLFEYQVPDHECAILFMEKSLPHRESKLTVIPYDTARYPGGGN